MNEALIRTRYAKALFDAALEQKKLEEVKEQAESLLVAFSEVDSLTEFLNNPLVNGDKKQAVFRAAFNGKVTGLLEGLVNLMFKNQRETLLVGVLRNFIDMYEAHIGVLRGSIRSVVPIDANLQKSIEAKLATELGKTIILKTIIDPELIGGFAVEVDGVLVDATIKNRLEKLKAGVL